MRKANPQAMSADERIAWMTNRVIKSVTLSDHKETVTFEFCDGSSCYFGVEGDCCSVSWIEHLEVPQDIDGATVTGFESKFMDSCASGTGDEIKIYQCDFQTDRGCVTLEFRNESNGYYGGFLV